MTPVAASEHVCATEIFSTGRLMSPIAAKTRPHFIAGAQKKMVLGPAGCSHIGLIAAGTCFSARRIMALYNIDAMLNTISDEPFND